MKTSLVFLAPFLFSLVCIAEDKSRFEKIELFSKVLSLVETNYYRKVDTEKLIGGAIKGMMATLDPHSSFLDKDIFKKMKEDTRGEFGGLGIEVALKEGKFLIITAIDGTPAHRARLKYGDTIVEINGQTTLGMSLDEAVQLMRGRPGTKLTIGISGEKTDEIKQITLTREKIRTRSVKASLVNDNYLYVKLIQFQKNSSKDIEKAMKKLKKQAQKKGGIKGMVLDLRKNPGGLLDEAIKISSLFLADGVVVSTEVRKPGKGDIHYVFKGGYKELDIPMAVLINGSSASASEIVAGALQDHGRAIVMGTRSFGKGSVQTIAKVDEEQGVKLTIAQYMTPLKKRIQAVGIKPDIISSEYEGRYDSEMAKGSHYVRESSLRNHLTATIESDEEKKLRTERELSARKRKIARRKRDKKNQGDGDVVGIRTPAEDFQVVQAIKHLKSFAIAKRMLAGEKESP